MINNITFDKENDVIELILCQDRSIRLTFEEGAEFARRLIEVLRTGKDNLNTIVLSRGLTITKPLEPIKQSQVLVCSPYTKILDTPPSNELE